MEINEKVERVNAQYRQRNGLNRGLSNPSLSSFLKKEPINQWLKDSLVDGAWAELGCGEKSLFEEELLPGIENKSDLWGFDLSDVAIDRANSWGRCHYHQADLTKGIPYGPYQILLDGHFLHSLCSLPEVFTVLGHILQSLRPGGRFIGEVMTLHKNISFDSDLYFDFDKRVLFQGSIPIRTILEAREWEDLFKNCGFEIEFFVCQASIKMIPGNKRSEPMTGDPECLRFTLKRPNTKNKGISE